MTRLIISFTEFNPKWCKIADINAPTVLSVLNNVSLTFVFCSIFVLKIQKIPRKLFTFIGNCLLDDIPCYDNNCSRKILQKLNNCCT